MGLISVMSNCTICVSFLTFCKKYLSHNKAYMKFAHPAVRHK